MARLLLTRPRAASERFRARIEPTLSMPVETIISPVMEIEFRDPIPLHVAYDAVVLGSENAARAAALWVPSKGTRAFCVGARTGLVARNLGFSVVSANGDSRDLLKILLATESSLRFLHIRGDHSAGEIVQTLRRNGREAAEEIAYCQRPLSLTENALNALAGKIPIVLPLFSPRSATLFFEQGPFEGTIHAVAMSENVASCIPLGSVENLTVVETPDIGEMLEATLCRLASLA